MSGYTVHGIKFVLKYSALHAETTEQIKTGSITLQGSALVALTFMLVLVFLCLLNIITDILGK